MIAKQFTGSTEEHYFIGPDTHGDKGEAITFCIAKARLIIEEHGDRMFGGDDGANP